MLVNCSLSNKEILEDLKSEEHTDFNQIVCSIRTRVKSSE